MRITLDCAGKLFRAIGTPRALSCLSLMTNGEWDQLASLRLDPMHYNSARAYYLDAVATEFLRKHRDLPTSFDKALEAEKKFWESERLCASTNARFSRINHGSFADPIEERLGSFCSEVKREIHAMLRSVPAEVFPRFGPGATFDDKGQLTTVADKMMSVPTLTRSAEPLLEMWKHTAWGRGYLSRPEKRGRLRFEDSDRFTTVPKDSKTDRSIAIQPSINVFYQLGVGDAMRNRLRAWGIDLNGGQDIHRRVACEGSATGEYATIDLSSASDTISKEVVKALLPSAWYSMLRMLRTTHTTLSGKRVYLEKFSAMGNGFTFELETAVFSALVKVTLSRLGLDSRPGRDFWVYGDDIIVPHVATGAVLTVLRTFGFLPNARKTFSTGLFRESCGGDFFDGQPVRAYYLKEEPVEPHNVIALANGLRRIYTRLDRCDDTRRRLVKVWHSVLDLLPVDIRRLRGPETLGDLVIHDDRHWDVRNVLCRRGPEEVHLPRSWISRDMREIRVWQPVPKRLGLQHFSSWAVFAAALYGVDSRGLTPRGAVSGYRRAWVSLIE